MPMKEKNKWKDIPDYIKAYAEDIVKDGDPTYEIARLMLKVVRAQQALKQGPSLREILFE